MRKKIAGIISSVIILLIVSVVLIVKFVPLNEIPFISQSDSPIAEVLCVYPVKVSGDSMEPFLHVGETVNFDKCFEKMDLRLGQVVLYKDGAVMRMGIIRSVQDVGRLVYNVSNEVRAEEVNSVLPDEVVGILDIDTSSSRYQAGESEVMVDDNLANYMSEAYLAKIPRGGGIETSDVVESAEFDLRQDKFCFVVNPIKDIRNVDFVISVQRSDEEVIAINDVIFQPGENVNCDDELIKLDKGDYFFKIFAENILLKSIPFRVI